MDYINECVVDGVEYSLVSLMLESVCSGCVADGDDDLCVRINDCCYNKDGEKLIGNFIWIKKELK